MTSRKRLRRSAAVPRKLLNLLTRRFVAAVLRRFAGVPKTSIRSMCGGSAAVSALNPHTPIGAPRRLVARRGRIEAGRDVTSRMIGLSRHRGAPAGSDLSLVPAVAGELAAAAKARLR
jgi:hypothetical protein